MPPNNETSEEDSDDEWESRVRTNPAKGQSPVFKGVNLLGKETSIALIFASTFKGGGTASGRAAKAKVLGHMAGTSLHHIPGFENCISTADHCLEGCIEDFEEEVCWEMEIWAMPAAHFQDLDDRDKWDLHVIREKGAVKAEGYFSYAQDRKFRKEVHGRPEGLDVGIVKLLGPLTGLSAAPNQPRILSRMETGNVIAFFFTQRDVQKKQVEIVLQGTGTHTSVHKKKKNKNRQQRKKAVTSVLWTKPKSVCWTWTTITGMSPQQFGMGVYLATWLFLPLRYAGKLSIYESYVPRGFSGGGAYTMLPARALNPTALATDPDVPVLLGNIATWGFCSVDAFYWKVIYGQKIVRTLSAVCFLFCSWFTNVKKGKFRDDEVKDEETQFWLIKQVISIIFLDRRNDDVISVEGETGAGGEPDNYLEERIFNRLPSTIRVFFSVSLGRIIFKVGKLKDGGDRNEDEDTQFWLSKILISIIFLISIILLDRCRDDVLSLEGRGGGDLEEEGIYKMLSIICFFFSSLFTDFFFSLFGDCKEGIFQDGGDQDEDTRFGLIKFLMSIILLDRRRSYDDVLKTEVEGGGRGDLEEHCIHFTNVALLTREGLAQQMSGNYYRF